MRPFYLIIAVGILVVLHLKDCTGYSRPTISSSWSRNSQHGIKYLKSIASPLRALTINAPDSSQKEVIPPGKSSGMASSINLMKNCVGAGVLSLNGKVNFITSNPSDYRYVYALTFLILTWAIHNFYIVGESCRLTGKTTFPETWSAVVNNKASLRFVTFVITVAPMISCIANTIVLTDVLRMLLRVARAPVSIYGNRNLVVFLLTSCILYPICTVENLSGLKNVSIVGLSGHFLAMGAMLWRVIDGSYAAPAGIYRASALIHPPTIAAAATASPGAASNFFQGQASKWLVLASLLSYCCVTHYNAPRYYSELHTPPGKLTSRTFLNMVMRSYWGSATVYSCTMYLVYRLFGPYSQSFSLNSFSPQDPLALLAFLSFGLSVLASYPLLFLNVRNSVQKALRGIFDKKTEADSKSSFFTTKTTAAILLSGIGLLASLWTDIGKIGSVAGAFFGSSMMFIFPPILYIQSLRKFGSKVDGISASERRTRILFNAFLLVCGLGLGVLGTINAVLSLFR